MTLKGRVSSGTVVFMTLIDQRPDSQNHVSHLLITEAEKTDLQDQVGCEAQVTYHSTIRKITTINISAAIVLRGAFQKGYKCAKSILGIPSWAKSTADRSTGCSLTCQPCGLTGSQIPGHFIMDSLTLSPPVS